MEYNLTSELKALLKYIKENIAVRYRMGEIDIPTFMLGVVEFRGCDAHNGLKSLMLSSDFDSLRDTLIHVHETDMASRSDAGNLNYDPTSVTFHERFDAALKAANENPPIDSISFWLALDRIHSFQGQTMQKYGITSEQLSSFIRGKKGRRDVRRTPSREAAVQHLKWRCNSHSRQNTSITHMSIPLSRIPLQVLTTLPQRVRYSPLSATVRYMTRFSLHGQDVSATTWSLSDSRVLVRRRP